MNPLEAFHKKGSTWTLYGAIWAHWKTYLASYRLVILIAQAQSKRIWGRNFLDATLAGAVLMHRGESEGPSEAQSTQYGPQKRGASIFISNPTGMMDFQNSKLRPPTRNQAPRPSETRFRVKRNNFLVQGQKEGNWFRLLASG